MRRIVLTLTDDEYAVLEQRAQQARRTVREMAAFLATRPAPAVVTITPDWTYRPQLWNPLWPPQVTTCTTANTGSLTCDD